MENKKLIDTNACPCIKCDRLGNCRPGFCEAFAEWWLSPVDAVEVVHGRWERCFEDWRRQIEGDKCSACGFEHYGCGIKHYHYCPNCGADMRGENNGE